MSQLPQVTPSNPQTALSLPNKQVIDALEASRKETKKKILVNSVIIGSFSFSGVILAYGWSIGALIDPVAVGLGILGLGAILLTHSFSLGNRKLYRTKYKQTIIESFVESDPRLKAFDATKKINKKNFNDSGIFEPDFSSYEGEDLLTGNFGMINFTFSELKAETRGESIEYHFNGFFIVLEGLRTFPHYVRMVPRGLFSKMAQNPGAIPREKHSKETELTTGNLEFDGHYSIWSNHKEYPEWLTERGISLLSGLQKLTKEKPLYAFKGHKIYAAFPGSKNMLEPKGNKKAADEAQLKRIYEELSFILQLAEGLANEFGAEKF